MLTLQRTLQKITMKYVRKGCHTFNYQRDFPVKLQKLIGRKTFTYPLGDGRSEADLSRNVADASEAYQVTVKMATVSDLTAYRESEIIALVKKQLASKGMTEGQLVRDYPIDPELTALEQSNHAYNDSLNIAFDDYWTPTRPTYLQETPQDVADEMFQDVISDDQYRRSEGRPETINDKVNAATYEALLAVSKKKTKTLRHIWQPYIEAIRKNIIDTPWQRYLLLTGDKLLTQEADRQFLNESLRNYRDNRRGVVIEATIGRELSTIIACLNHTSRENDLDWNIVRPMLYKDPPKSRPVLSQEEQVKLVDYCLNMPSDARIDAAVTILLFLHGGIIFTEISRMGVDEQMARLNSKIPHVTISPYSVTKTQARPRAVPIVYGLNMIKKGIKQTIEFNNFDSNTRTRYVRKIILDATGTSYVPYSLRHTFRANCVNNHVSNDHTGLLGGWSSMGTANNQVMLKYGAADLGSDSQMKALLKSQKKAQVHLRQYYD